MVLGLNQECRNRLAACLEEALREVVTRNGMFVERDSLSPLWAGDGILPAHGGLRSRIEEYVNDSPFSEFVEETLSRELHQLDQYQSNTPTVPLREIDPFKDTKQLAKRLVDEFESLPWEYEITLPLPKAATDYFPGERHDLSSEVSILPGSSGLAATHPLSTGVEARDRILHRRTLLMISEAPSWSDDQHYLQVRASGFVGWFGKTNPTLTAEGHLKAFCGLALASRIFNIQRRYQKGDSSFYVHRKVGSECAVNRRFEVEEVASSTLEDLGVDPFPDSFATDDSKRDWTLKRLREIGAVFSSSNGKRILLASQWLFDSYSARNQLLSFVQAMVVLEILLGDDAPPKEGGIGELLRNRCAFLIGRTRSERETLLDEFNSIYQVRSQIVHRGKSRFVAKERYLFYRLQLICRRAIQEEVRLLVADVQNPESGR